MSQRADEPGYLERVRAALSALSPIHSASDEARDDGGGESADDGALISRPLELAARTISGSLERWRRSGGFLQFLRASGRDQLVVLGETVDLEASLEAPLRLRARLVRFFVNGEPVGEVPTGAFDRTVRCRYTPRAVGVHDIRFEVLDRADAVIIARATTDRVVLQVVDAAPVLAVHGDLLLAEPALDLSPLRALAGRGWMIAYFDFDASDRARALLEAMERQRLPIGARLIHSAESRGLTTLGVDFRPVFERSLVRALRADGVPLAAVLCDVSTWPEDFVDAIERVELETLARRLAAGRDAAPGVGLWEESARAFVDARRRARDPLRWRLDQRTGTRLVHGNRCEVEFDNRRARERVFELIESAASSVHLQFYIVRDGRFTEHLAARLVARARAGVRVRMTVDALYSTQDVLGLRNEILEGLAREPGVDIVASDPIASAGELELGLLKRRDHRKLIVVDGRVAIVSGRNCSDEYYTGFDEIAVSDWTRSDRVPWLDAHVEVHGPLVGEIQRCFLANWRRCGGPEVNADDEAALLPALETAGECAARLVVHDGLSDSNALGAYEAMIRSARAHIYVLNDFPIVSALLDALLAALSRGVVVTILTGNANARRDDGTLLRGPLHREIFEYMTKQRLEPLMRAGARLSEYRTPRSPLITTVGGCLRPYVHAKVVTADARVVSIGSANLDVTASYWEREANVIIEDAAVASAIEAQIQEMLARSYAVDPDSEYWRAEAGKREVSARLWPGALS
ncbi:MAG: phosphatidylserine/phosphatidylglycerophosphate/cardiolipin synthase family protein [Myxococcales bacterium]|nr:phosphatidylserine/phosphatidylglycerophosphate/cardiolipin synthase family protein [Myxococcales bacterium]